MRFQQLEPWQELFGTFEEITVDDGAVVAVIAGYTLRYPRRTPEAEFLIKHLTKGKIGKKVGILNAEKELRIRWPDEQLKSNEPSPFWKWYCKTYGIPEGW